MADTPTPGNPGTYLPIPGQKRQQTNDQKNAAQIKSQNTVPTEGAASANDFAVGSDGKLYTGKTTPIVDATIQKVQEFTDSVTQAKGPKGDKGEPGEPGPRGPAGPAGGPGVVDYDRIRDMIQEMLDAALNLKSLRFTSGSPGQVFGTKTINLAVELYDQLSSTAVGVTPTWSIAPANIATITTSGVLTATNPANDTSIIVTASYTDGQGKSYTATKTVTVRALKVSSLAVGGSTTLTANATVVYTATASYTDGSSKVVTADPATTWVLTNSAIGVLTANSLKVVASTTTNISGIVRATYVEAGTTVTGQANVSLAAPVVQQPKPYFGAAAHPTAGGTITPSITTADWDAFVRGLSGRATNSGKNNTFTTSQGVDQYGWYAYPKTYGLMTQAQIKGAGQPGPGGWDSANAPNGHTGSAWSSSGPLEIKVTVDGVLTDFYLYRTDNKTTSGVFTESWTVS